jgi:tetratricopeptide (TPR) repeat protein/tRNA A-37 threonylcarbamoyl transferase component Bud32
MSDKGIAPQISYPELIDNRYQVDKILGKGGMAIVYQVRDTKTGREVALKQLLVKEDAIEQKEVTELFEHEFHILAQLAHPRVIEVYDYGRNEVGAYYTMELLDGGDIRELAPLPWKTACSLFIDVCSALGLIHSRRQLHRDLTPRNVRCTRDGKAKLIDFGAMTPMGPCKRLLGTPAFTPPEIVGLQTIDARSDLYAIGATMYYALTGRAVFRAGTFAELRDAWRSKPLPPSSIVEDIPKELDTLVLSLINLDLMARPVNAAEVMEKLSAIAGIEIDDKLLASRAYLSKPMLVGRDEHVIPVRKQMMEAITGNGGAFFIEGASGAGRSRFLDTCVLEGRMVGATVLRADASDSYAGAWGVVKVLASQLIDALPEVALEMARPHVALLGQILPDLVSRLESAKVAGLEGLPAAAITAASGAASSPFDHSAEVWGRGYSSRPPPPPGGRASIPIRTASPQELRPRIQAALADWWLKVSAERCLVVAIDDIHRVDEPSAAFIALLSPQLSKSMLVLAVTAETDAATVSPVAIKLLKQSSAKLRVGNLKLEHTEKLINSVFGDVANLKLMASKLQTISNGNPRAIMQLLQHLVDKGLIRYQSGAWTLPSAIDAGDLPSSLNEALVAKVGELHADSRCLAQTLALTSDQRFSYEECQVLTEHRDTKRLIQDLDELVAAEILATDGLNYWLSQQTWAPVLVESMDEQTRRGAHLRMAEMLEKRGDRFRVGQHLLRGGQAERALDVLIAFSEISKATTSKNPGAYPELLQSLPRDWQQTIQAAIELAIKLGRPRKQVFILQARLSGLVAAVCTYDTGQVTAYLQQLYHDCGLDIFKELGDSVPFQERLGRMFRLAQERYEAAPVSERVLPPKEAVGTMAAGLVEAAGLAWVGDNYDFYQSLPLIGPLTFISPAIAVIDKLNKAIGCGVMGRIEENYRGDLEAVDRIDQPDHAGFEGAHHLYLRFGITQGLGIMAGHMGLDTALKWAEETEQSPILQVNAWRIRKVYHLWQGATGEAEKCQEQVEMLQIQNSPGFYYRTIHLCPELRVYCLSDDLSGIKRLMEDLEKTAGEFPNWLPVLHYARGEYQRIRGDHQRALKELKTALEIAAPGRNQNWAYIAGGYLRTLLELGEHEKAESEGRQFVQAALEQKLQIVVNFLRMPLAIAEAKQGHTAEAVATAESAIESFKGFGSTGLSLGLAYETRARVGAIAKDDETFQRFAKLCGEQYRTGRNPALSAKYEKLMQEARTAKIGITVDLASAADFTQLSAISAPTQMATLLEVCKDPKERASRALDFLIKLTNSIGGFLFTMRKEGPVLCASDGKFSPPPEMDTLVVDRLTSEIEGHEDITQDGTDEETSCMETADWATQMGEEYRSVLLGHTTSEGYALTGMAILVTSPKKTFKFPAETVEVVSRALFDSGDVAKVFAAD